MLKVQEHSELLSAQNWARCLEPGNVCHPITTRTTHERQMKETLYTRHQNTIKPIMVEKNRKAKPKTLHTDTVDKAVKSRKECGARWSASANKQFRKRPHHKETLNPRSIKILYSYKSRIKKDASLYICASLRLPGSADHNETVRFMEQTDGRCPGTQLSRGERPILK